MKHDEHDKAPHMWAYGYKLTPPMARDLLSGIQALLDDGHRDASQAAQIWSGRFINGDEIGDILIVSGSPDQNLEVNRKLNAELQRLHAVYWVTPSLEVLDALE